jgi:predicted sulfurtransferase
VQCVTACLLACLHDFRCLRRQAYIRSQGVDNVSQLKGGIHRYLEAFPEDGGQWHGRNFVFDARVSMAAAGLESGGAADGAPAAAASVGVGVGGGADNAKEASRRGPEVIGRCSTGCGTPCDKLSGNNVCCLCKDLVIVCDGCDADPEHADLFCHRHVSCAPSCARSCIRAFVRAFMRACARACVRACLRACVPACAAAGEWGGAEHGVPRRMARALVWRCVLFTISVLWRSSTFGTTRK